MVASEALEYRPESLIQTGIGPSAPRSYPHLACAAVNAGQCGRTPTDAGGGPPVRYQHVILIRNRNGINNPIPGGDGAHAIGGVFKSAQSDDQVIFECIDAVEDAVMEVLLA